MDAAKVDSAARAIAQAIAEHNPVKVYALVSGGNDSTVTAHLAKEYGPRLDGIVHIDTGIGVDETREYVRSFADWLKVPLIVKRPSVSYEDLVMKYGFPGPAAHRYMYIQLKERPLREVRREAQQGRSRRVLFITGVRTSESHRRMGYARRVQRDGNTVWVAPIRDFDHRDIWNYRDRFSMPSNEVVEVLHMSGECLCGAFAKPGELDWLALFYPPVAQRIRRLEEKAHASGLKSGHWGPQSSKEIREAPGPLCVGCSYDHEEAADPRSDQIAIASR